MKSRTVILIITVGLLASGCIYSESEVYRVEPVPGISPVISVTTNLDSLEYLIVLDSLEVSWSAEVENGEFYQLELFIGQVPVYSTDSAKGVFWIRSTVVKSPGIYPLYMLFYYSTNTNTLADMIGLEASVLDLEFELQFEGPFYFR